MSSVNIFDGYKDRTGFAESCVDLSFYSNYEFPQNKTFVCFDARKCHVAGLPLDKLVYDIKLFYPNCNNLSDLVRSESLTCNVEYGLAEKRFSAHTRAISEGMLDMDQLSIRETIPEDVRHEFLSLRVRAVSELWSKISDEKLLDYENHVWPAFRDILKIENSKIAIDETFVKDVLKKGVSEVHIRKFLEHILSCTKNGFARTKITPVGSKTWRFRVENGFNCMSIPHGIPRKAIVSRWEGGRIATLDFNAVDYRCLVKAVDDNELNEFYSKQEDFHAATLQLCSSDVKRESIKKITYAHIYGSSIEGLMKLTLLGREKLTGILGILDNKFLPISNFRTKLAAESRKNGFLFTPNGLKVLVSSDDHDGKIVGLFAQTYSSSVLIKTINSVLNYLEDKLSKLIFTVHDEIVLDIHPSELFIVEEIKSVVEKVTGFKMKLKLALNYDEATS